VNASPQTYTVQIERDAAKVLRRLDGPIRQRISAAIDSLTQTPRPSGVKALTGHPGLLRIRVGDYRIVYTVRDAELIVLVLHLGHRSSIYDDL